MALGPQEGEQDREWDETSVGHGDSKVSRARAPHVGKGSEKG